MRTTTVVVLGAAMLTATVACGSSGDSASSTDGGGEEVTIVDADDGADVEEFLAEGLDPDREGRAFGAGDSTIESALNMTLKPDDIRWEDDGLYIVFDKPAQFESDRMRTCVSAQAVLADDEQAFVVYPDEEVDCSRFGAD